MGKGNQGCGYNPKDASLVRGLEIWPFHQRPFLLNVPHYDFNWQLAYRTALHVPKGTHMRFDFSYDNSPNNKNNPDPSRWVYQGFQSWEEMMAPNLAFLLDRDADVGGLITISN